MEIWIPVIVAIISGIASSFAAILVFVNNEKTRKQALAEMHTTELKNTERAIQQNLDSTREDCINTINKLNERMENIEDNISELKAEYQSKTAIIELQIANLEKKQAVHNNLISRTYALESNQKLHEEQIKVANHRIEDLERNRA